MIVGTEENYRN